MMASQKARTIHRSSRWDSEIPKARPAGLFFGNDNYFLAAFFTADFAATGFAAALVATGFAIAAFFAVFGADAFGAAVFGAATFNAEALGAAALPTFLASSGFLVAGATFLVTFFWTAFSVTGVALDSFLEALPPKIPLQPSEYFSFVPTRVIVTESPFNQN